MVIIDILVDYIKRKVINYKTGEAFKIGDIKDEGMRSEVILKLAE